MNDADAVAGEPDTTLDPDRELALAVRLFGRVWTLLDTDRDGAADLDLLAVAMASRLHWQAVGDAENHVVGDWMVAHVASRLGYADLALDFAAAAHERVTADSADSADPLPAWLLASTQEGLARAHSAAGHTEERDPWVLAARTTLAGVEDAEDRELIESQLADIP